MRKHANAQRRLDQIYDVDPIEARIELKNLGAFPTRSRSSHRLMLCSRLELACWVIVRRAAAAEQLAVPPVARLRLRTAHDASKVCSTVPVSISVATQRTRRLGGAREAVRRASSGKTESLKRLESRSGYRPWSDSGVRHRARSRVGAPPRRALGVTDLSTVGVACSSVPTWT